MVAEVQAVGGKCTAATVVVVLVVVVVEVVVAVVVVQEMGLGTRTLEVQEVCGCGVDRWSQRETPS